MNTAILVLVVAVAFGLWWMLMECNRIRKKYWDQLLRWRDWKYAMESWIKAYEKYFADNCTCNVPDPPDPPESPTWPNGVEPH